MRYVAPLRMLILVLTTFHLLSCGTPSQPPLRFGINPWPGYEFLYLAQEKGFYAQLGVPVKMVEYGSLSELRRAYERGNLDLMASTLIEVLQVKNNSKRSPKIFLIADFSFGGDMIIARHPIRKIADLKGKRVSADTASLPIFVLARALELAGLSIKDVVIVPLEQPDMETAYNKGEVDAVVTYPPVSVRLQARKDSSTIFTSKEVPGEIMDVVSVEASVLAQRPDDINKIHKAWGMALKYAQENPKDAHAIMAKREGISVEEFSAALQDLKLVSIVEQGKYYPLIKPSLNRIKNILTQLGVITATIADDCCIADFKAQ